MGNRRLKGWAAPELLMLAGGLVACAAAAASGQRGAAIAIGPAALTVALLAARIRLLPGRGALQTFYAATVVVLGGTVAGQGYLRMAIDGGGSHPVWEWLAVAGGLTALAGGAARLMSVTSAAGSRYSRAE
ncbi:MAG: hypothetical protein ACTHNU_12020 [Gaiellales bacterium]